MVNGLEIKVEPLKFSVYVAAGTSIMYVIATKTSRKEIEKYSVK